MSHFALYSLVMRTYNRGVHHIETKYYTAIAPSGREQGQFGDDSTQAHIHTQAQNLAPSDESSLPSEFLESTAYHMGYLPAPVGYYWSEAGGSSAPRVRAKTSARG